MKQLLLRSLLSMLPTKYLPRLMQHLSDLSYDRWVGVDEEVMLEQGILSNSTCTTPMCVETELIDWIRKYPKPGQVLYDIGANVGAYSLYAAKHHKGKVKVYAFEPAAPTIPLLIHNIIRNGCTGTVVPMTFPLAAKPTLAAFNYHTRMTPGFARHAFGEAIDHHGDAFEPVFQEFLVSTTLDQLVSEYHVQPPNHIKIDVDGLEFEILSGGAELLRSGVVESLFFEMGGRFEMSVVIPFLDSCGFEQKSTFHHDNTDNVLFVRKDRAQ
ncbi:MAG TPA: FkbM family methyltransferase [Pirellulales bacterium]|nr:FkbM family methyltransferase [Pirellulales bacterium]